MELTKSFPPADALVAMLRKIEYRKIANQIVTVALFAAAIAQVLFERAQVWWLNGGKEQTVKVVNFVAEYSKAAFTVAIPNTISFAKEVKNAADLAFDNFMPTPKL
jgi:hypothetical protein